MLFIVGNLTEGELARLRALYLTFPMVVKGEDSLGAYEWEVEAVGLEMVDFLRLTSVLGWLVVGLKLGGFYELNIWRDKDGGYETDGREEVALEIIAECASDDQPGVDDGDDVGSEDESTPFGEDNSGGQATQDDGDDDEHW